jgi:hypothetical protein
MKKHAEHGECILRETTHIDESSIRVTARHHERLDGTGEIRDQPGVMFELRRRVFARFELTQSKSNWRSLINEPLSHRV